MRFYNWSLALDCVDNSVAFEDNQVFAWQEDSVGNQLPTIAFLGLRKLMFLNASSHWPQSSKL